MANDAYKAFLRDPDRVSRRAELAAFAGPNAAKFLKTYDTQAATAQRPPGEKIPFDFFKGDFIWPVFFVGPVWFFYRKMWAWGAGVATIILVLGLIPATSRLSVPIAVAMAGASSLIYLAHAVKTIERMRAASPTGVLAEAELAAAGGVSKRAGWISGVIYGLLTAFGLYGAVLDMIAGRSPH